ncbi:MAG: MaoC family dehydratase N-terminal domain-containing protein [Anaerolineales bacterium]|nr:MaoC family dehydratase N-terminal domain-containing protein [Anaerolineales bacterium]
MSLASRRGLYFEEFAVGQKIITMGRTITETDVVSFAGLSGDYNQIHTDAAYAAGTPFGQRIAHGLCVMSIASGLVTLTGVMEGTVLAFREVQEWKFSKPVFFGDTIHVEAEVTETKAVPRLKGGAVSIKLNVLNQKGEVTQSGRWSVLMLSQPAA